MASIASLLSASGAAGPFGLVIWWVTAGFFSVYLYRRRTGHLLTVDGGLRMGWITGLLGSAMMSVLSSISLIALISGGKLTSVYQEQLNKMYANQANVQEALRIIQTPTGMTIFVILALVFLFLIITFLSTAGGAMGAKLVGGVGAPRP